MGDECESMQPYGTPPTRAFSSSIDELAKIAVLRVQPRALRAQFADATGHGMSVSIKVAVRCRPFTIDDRLGVNLSQSGDEEGEV